MTAEREKLGDLIASRSLNFVPGVGECLNVTLLPSERDEILRCLCTPSFNDAIEAAAKALDGLKMNSFDEWGAGWNQALEVGARDIRALSLPAPGEKS